MKRLTANAIKNVIPPYLDEPKGIDMVVRGLQSAFGDISWMEKSFARAIIMYSLKEEREYIYPAMFIERGYDYLDMLLNDNYDAYSFFLAHDPEETVEYIEGVRNYYKRDLSAIVWMNLDRIYSDRQTDYKELIKQELRSAIQNAVYEDTDERGQVISVEITNTYDEPSQIFEGFTINLADTQNLSYTYGGLRIDMECHYTEECE